MLKIVVIALCIIAVQANAVCGTQIVGAKTAEDARQRAAASLAIAINSKLSFHSKSEETIDGRKSSQKDSTIQKIDSKLLNAQAAKYEDGKNESGYFSKACMSNENAAMPYLKSMRELAGKLKNAGEWENVVTIYNELKSLEEVLIPLGQMDEALRGKYDADYAKAEKEHNALALQEAARGVYLGEIKGARAQTISDKLKEVLTSNNCRMEEKPKSNSFTLKIDAKDCDIRNDGTFDYCSACAKIEVIDGKDKKSGLNASITKKVGWDNKEIACEKAAEASAPEIWSKVKGKIKEACE
jgi:hypothetical protein